MISIKREIERIHLEDRYFTESGKKAPYPDMTDDDLSAYEKWEFIEYGIKPMYDWDWYSRFKDSVQQSISREEAKTNLQLLDTSATL